MKKNLLSVILSPILLLGCDSGDDTSNNIDSGSEDSDDNNSSPTSNPTYLSGQVIDGYIEGATVFLDINNNGILDSNEPYDVTNNNGTYNFNLESDERVCTQYVPIIANVPVGALDLDQGIITTAYQMVLPPRFELINGDDNHITPVTSDVWNKVQAYKSGEETISSGNRDAITQVSDNISCSQAKVSIDRITVEKQVMELAENDVTDIYGINEDTIYKDFVKNENTELLSKAEENVELIAKGKTEAEIIMSNDANISKADIEYIRVANAIDNWIKYTNITYNDNSTKNIKDYVYFIDGIEYSHNRSTVKYKSPVILDDTSATFENNSVWQSVVNDICSINSEINIESSQVSMSITNINNNFNASTEEDCKNHTITKAEVVGHELKIYYALTTGEAITTYYYDASQGVPPIHDILLDSPTEWSDEATYIANALAVASSKEHEYNSDSLEDASSIIKQMFVNEAGNRIEYYKHISGSESEPTIMETRYIYYSDGSVVYQTYNDGSWHTET